jgi:hypothetical protein
METEGVEERVSHCYIYIVCGEVFNTTGSWRLLLERTINYILITPTVKTDVFYYFFLLLRCIIYVIRLQNQTRKTRNPSILSCQVITVFIVVIDCAEFHLQPIPAMGTLRLLSLFFLNT